MRGYEEIMTRKLKIVLTMLFYCLIFLPWIIFFLGVSGKEFFLISGFIYIIYAIIGMIFKLPIFNRHYVYKSVGFDESFGIRHYFGLACLLTLGIIFSYMGF